MSLFPDQDRIHDRPPEGAAGCAPPSADGRVAGRAAERYLRVTGPVLRGRTGMMIAVAAFVAAFAIGGRAGPAVASVYVIIIGTYCSLNFLHCRETHCGVTGPGWLLTAGLGFVSALVPGTSLSWYRTRTELVAYLVVLAAGYALEWAVSTRTGRRTLGRPGAAG